jgi:hypothetical protein
MLTWLCCDLRWSILFLQWKLLTDDDLSLFCSWGRRGGSRGGTGTVRGRGRGRSGRGGGRGRGRKDGVEKSAEQLDKELETYHAEAMNIS